MIWLILQMLVCLVLAFGLGLLLGWWLRGLGVDEARRRDDGEWEQRIADYKRRLEARGEECQDLTDRLAACEARCTELARRLGEALAARDASPAPASPAGEAPPDGPPDSPDRWVVSGDEPSATE